MFEESATAMPSSIWASINSCFTSTVLFILLNLMIAIIAITSKRQNEPNHPKIARSPSLLHRLKSINFYPQSREPQNHQEPINDSDTVPNPKTLSHDYFFQEVSRSIQRASESKAPYLLEESPEQSQTQYVCEPDDSQDAFDEKKEEDEFPSMDEVYSKLSGSHFSRTKSDTEPASGSIPTKLPARMRKSAFGHFQTEEIVEARRPATVRERGNARVTEGDEGVDAKADDFISKFRRQLQLQRLESVIRCQDMIGGRSGEDNVI